MSCMLARLLEPGSYADDEIKLAALAGAVAAVRRDCGSQPGGVTPEKATGETVTGIVYGSGERIAHALVAAAGVDPHHRVLGAHRSPPPVRLK